MASKHAVASALAILGEAFPTREVTSRTAEVWLAIFGPIPDEDLAAAVLSTVRDPARKFFPSSGELFAAIGASKPAVDSGAVIRRISALGQYSPHCSWIYPGVEAVRESLGDPIANAYAAAGADRIFANDDTVTQDIARRSFATELQAAQQRNPTVPLLPPNTTKRLTAGEAA